VQSLDLVHIIPLPSIVVIIQVASFGPMDPENANDVNARKAMRELAAARGLPFPTDAFLDEAARLSHRYDAGGAAELEKGNLSLRPNFCAWNVKMTLAYQAGSFAGFKMVFGSMGFPVGDDVFWEFGGPDYTTVEDFKLVGAGRRGYDGHFWLAHESTGEVADVSFPHYRVSSIFRCLHANKSKSYKMKREYDGKWVIALPSDWRKFGLVHLPASAEIQTMVMDEFLNGGGLDLKHGSGQSFTKADVKRVRKVTVATLLYWIITHQIQLYFYVQDPVFAKTADTGV
jgi:hypothetical protein